MYGTVQNPHSRLVLKRNKYAGNFLATHSFSKLKNNSPNPIEQNNKIKSYFPGKCKSHAREMQLELSTFTV